MGLSVVVKASVAVSFVVPQNLMVGLLLAGLITGGEFMTKLSKRILAGAVALVRSPVGSFAR